MYTLCSLDEKRIKKLILIMVNGCTFKESSFAILIFASLLNEDIYCSVLKYWDS